ncbi:microtubule-associated tyrosine carboxypeptidase 1 [Pleurodeles waltl]|uniref:microtubule-associated tyrosine carboxypeptidase 1 n=1 Tax=Pleurodeles waltl TaxID=8319 RepID=UPI003709984A
MVLGSVSQTHRRTPSMPSLASAANREAVGKKRPEQNGPQLHSAVAPTPQSRPTSSSAPPSRTKTPTKANCTKSQSPKSEVWKPPGCPGYMGHCTWMRRSESSCTVNTSSSGGGGSGWIRTATSFPHLPKSNSREVCSSSKSPCLLVALRPTNVDEERDKFFQSNYTYNPQFQYQDPIPTGVLAKYSHASEQFIIQAIRILHAVLEKYGTYENFEVATGGNRLSKCQIWTNIRKYMLKEGCTGEIVVQLTEDLLSQAVMMVENSRPTLTINLSGARQYWLEGMLRHEIGTHYLRGVNNARQPWHTSDGRRQYGLKPANPTEEGLASLHSVLFRKNPFLWRAALLYYTVYRAAQLPFSMLFRDLQQFVSDPKVRWEYCVRAKRGQTDTAQPGCFSKDQVYMDGILRLLRHRQTIDFQMLVALGKVSYEDVDRLKKFAMLENPRIPHFLRDQERYQQQLDYIIEVNQLNDEELSFLLPK